jgi:uncharacterized membrane protein
LTHPELFFAVTVNEQFRNTQTARRIVGQYQLLGWFVTGVVALLVYSGRATPVIGVNSSIAVWLLAALIARHQVLPHRTSGTTLRQAELRVRRSRFPGGIPMMVGPFIILAARAAYAYGRWDQIPERFPIHWGLNGPDKWVTRTPLAVYGSLASVALFSAAMIVLAYAIIHASRPAQSGQRFRQVSVLGLVALAYVFALVLPPVSGIPELPFAPFLILGVAIMIIGLSIWSGYQPGNTESSPAGDRTPDDCWKLGMIYYNPDDPALMIEKRFGIGWTLNFGNRLSWVVMAAIMCFPVLISLVAS